MISERTIRAFTQLICFLTCCLSFCQSDEIVVTQASLNISQNSVTAIIQDDEGFLWVGTRHGLNKHLGQKFEVTIHEPGDTSSILNSHITAFEKDNHGNLWIGTAGGGLSVYNTKSQHFNTYQCGNRESTLIGGDAITSIFIDDEGIVFVGLDKKGLSVFDPNLETFHTYTHDPNDPGSISNNDVTAIGGDSYDNIWIGTWGGGLNLFDKKTKKFTRYLIGGIHGSRYNTVRSIYTDSGTCLIGTNGGVFSMELDPKTSKRSFKPFLKDLPVLSMIKDAKARYWFGTENYGIHVIDSASGNRTNILSQNSIWSIFEDRVGTIWIGTYKNGLYKVDPFENRFNLVKHEPNKANSLSYNIVSCFTEDKEGNLWIGTDGGGLNYYSTSSGTFSVYGKGLGNGYDISSDAILDLLIDRNNNLWVATWEGGVSFKAATSSSFKNLNDEKKVLGSNVFDLLEDAAGNIWISCFRHGLNIYRTETETFDHLTIEDVGVILIRTMLQDNEGDFWFGTESKGVFKVRFDHDFNMIKKEHFTEDSDGVASLLNPITHLHQSDDSTLWIGTEGAGLNSINTRTNKIKRYTKKNGFISNVVHGILEDEDSNLWLSTGNGLTRFNPTTMQIMNYDVSDGIQHKEFFKGACFKTPEGELFFGGINGFNHFFPKNIKLNQKIPPVYITSLTVNGDQGISFRTPSDKKLKLRFYENDLTFTFSALNYSQPHKNKFRYFLVGVDKKWNEGDGENAVRYTNIPPGEYKFKVLASNNDGVWNEEGATFSFQIKKPWWGTNFAYAIYFIMITYMVYVMSRLRINRQKLQDKLRLEHLEVVKMQELDELKNRFFANISHEFKTPLTLIIDPLRNMYSRAKEEKDKGQYRIAIRNAERLLDLVKSLLDISRLESKTVKLQASYSDLMEVVSPIAFSFNSYSGKQFLNFKCIFPEEKVMICFEKNRLEKVVSNLLTNAFKYTPEYGEVTFEIIVEEKTVQLLIRDTGIGIPKEEHEHIFDRYYRVENSNRPGTGLGLALVKEIVELHKGKIEVKSEVDVGSEFRVTLLKGRDHFSSEEIVEYDEAEISLEEEKKKELILNQEELTVRDSGPVSDLQEETIPLLLVVEDNYEMRSYICKYLERKYKIVEADNGLKAIDIARQLIPDLIISDVSMPKLDGYTLCERIKNDEKTSHIPVILLTGKSSEKHVEEGFSKGADYYITKPFNTMLLELRIFNILQSRIKIRERVLEEHSRDVTPKEEVMSTKDKSFIEKIVACIEENISNSEFHIDHLCKTMGMSRMQLYRKLKGIVGLSANEFIRTIRLKKAAQLLRQKQYTVAEITYKVGFTDLHYFRVAFKKQFGVNPSDFKEKI